MENFPVDVLIEIFLKLPVIALVMSRSVCKRWLRIIQNPNFISLHLNRPIGNNPLLMLRTLRYYNDETEKVVLTMRYGEEDLYYEHEMPLKILSPSMATRDCPEFELRLIGPCNGLFCVTDTVDLVIFNPATGQFRNVPYNPHLINLNEVSYRVDDIGYFDNVGFGFDPVSNDYKVVKFVKDDDMDDDDNEVRFEVEIYSLGNNSWRELECTMPRRVVRLCSYSLFCNGAFHWLNGDCEEDDNEGDIYHILVFDLSKEAFKWLNMPDRFTVDDNLHLYLLVLEESLTVIVHEDFPALHYHAIEIWSMMKYGDNSSWKMLYNLNNVMEVERPLSFSNKREFFVEIVGGELASIDLTDVMEVERPLSIDNKEEHSLEMLDEPLALNNLNIGEMEKFYFDEVSQSVQAFRYRESLVSLN